MTDITQKVQNAAVIHSVYGRGIITDYVQISDAEAYVTVAFFQNETNIEKRFLASIAFENDILIFENAEMQRSIKLTIAHQKQAAVLKPEATRKKAFFEISQNDITNILIESVLHNETIANDLISLFDDEQYEKCLYEEAFGYLEHFISGASLTRPYKACIVVALSLIALKYYNGDLYSYVERKYRESRPATEKLYTWNMIQNGLYKSVGEFRGITQYFDKKSYVAVPIVYSCVPHYRLKDLFRIAYDIYKQKLLFDEDVSDEQIEDKVCETFSSMHRKDLISDSESIKGTNYLMSKYTQSSIYSGFGLNELSKIVAHCIRLIILHLTQPEDSFLVEAYYEKAYSMWVESFESDEKEKAKYESNKLISQPYFRLIQNRVHVFTGEFSMDESCDPNDIHISFYNGEDTLLRDCHISDPNSVVFSDENSAMSGYILKRQDIILYDSPLGKLYYTISSGGKTLYQSKGRLNRTVLFFDGKGNEIKPGSDYTGQLFVVSKDTNTEEYGENIKTVYREDGYCLSAVEVNNQDVFRFDGESYIFHRVSGSQLISSEIPWVEFVSMENKEYPVYSDVIILFSSSCRKEEVYIEVDNEQYTYGAESEISYSIRVLSRANDGNWVYTLKVFNLPGGYHSIRVFNAISKKQIKGANFGIVVDSDLRKQFISKDDKGILYELNGSIIEKQPLFYEYGATNHELHTFVKNLGHGLLLIYPSSVSFSVDEKNWMDIANSINLFDISESINSLSICGPRNMKAYYYDNDAMVKKQELNMSVDDNAQTHYSLYLAYLRTINGKKHVRVLLEYGPVSRFLIINYVPRVNRDESVFYYNPDTKKHVFRIIFDGSSKIKMVVRPLHEEGILFSKAISSGESVQIDDSVIEESVKFLTISLYGKKYGALFDPFQKDPFMSFPKYYLARSSAKVNSDKTIIKVENDLLSCKFFFDGTDAAIAEIIPSGEFHTPLISQVIESGEMISLDLSLLPFKSYRVLLSIFNDNESEKKSAPFYETKIRADSPFLKKTFTVSAFILDDKSRVNANYSIRFYKIEEIKERYFIDSSLMNTQTGIIENNIVAIVKRDIGMKYEVILRKKTETGLKKLFLKTGKSIIGAVLEKGGWA